MLSDKFMIFKLSNKYTIFKENTQGDANLYHSSLNILYPFNP